MARGDHLQQLYLVQPDCLRRGTTCGVTDHSMLKFSLKNQLIAFEFCVSWET